MLTKQDLDDLYKQLKPIVYESVTICGRVCYSPEDILRLGYELVATDPIKFEEYQQFLNQHWQKFMKA